MFQLSWRKEESAFLCRVEAGPDHGGLVWFIVDDGLGRHGWRELRLGSRLFGGDLLLDRSRVLESLMFSASHV
jgi:hypothetical protein